MHLQKNHSLKKKNLDKNNIFTLKEALSLSTSSRLQTENSAAVVRRGKTDALRGQNIKADNFTGSNFCNRNFYFFHLCYSASGSSTIDFTKEAPLLLCLCHQLMISFRSDKTSTFTFWL